MLCIWTYLTEQCAFELKAIESERKLNIENSCKIRTLCVYNRLIPFFRILIQSDQHTHVFCDWLHVKYYSYYEAVYLMVLHRICVKRYITDKNKRYLFPARFGSITYF